MVLADIINHFSKILNKKWYYLLLIVILTFINCKEKISFSLSLSLVRSKLISNTIEVIERELCVLCFISTNLLFQNDFYWLHTDCWCIKEIYSLINNNTLFLVLLVFVDNFWKIEKYLIIAYLIRYDFI